MSLTCTTEKNAFHATNAYSHRFCSGRTVTLCAATVSKRAFASVTCSSSEPLIPFQKSHIGSSRAATCRTMQQ